MARRLGTSLAALMVTAALATTAVMPGFAFGRMFHRPTPRSGSTFFCTQPVVVNGVTLKGDCYSYPTR